MERIMLGNNGRRVLGVGKSIAFEVQFVGQGNIDVEYYLAGQTDGNPQLSVPVPNQPTAFVVHEVASLDVVRTVIFSTSGCELVINNLR